MRYFDSEDNFLLSQAVLWQSDAYHNSQGATHGGSLTAPAFLRRTKTQTDLASYPAMLFLMPLSCTTTVLPDVDMMLLYYQARFYVSGVGRFASADTLVPDPTNPQQFNRYTYTLNNPLRYSDPTGHSCYNPTNGSPCVLSDGTSNSSFGLSSLPSLPPAVPQQPSPVFLGLPVDSEVITWANGIGANSFAANRANPNSPSYDGTYRNSGGLHPGLDFFAIAGTSVYSNVHGIVQIPSPYPGDAGKPIIDGKPSNVVVLLDNGMFVIFGHVQGIAGLTHGMEVFPGQLIGTVADQGSNSHVHLALRQSTPQGERVYNPANYFVDSAVLTNLPWSEYAQGETLYSISSFLYQPRDNSKNYWVDDALAVGVIR